MKVISGEGHMDNRKVPKMVKQKPDSYSASTFFDTLIKHTMIDLQDKSNPCSIEILELSVAVQTHIEKTVNVERSEHRKAHVRTIKTRLDEPVLALCINLKTDAEIIPGGVYSDQNGIMYFAYSNYGIRNIEKFINKSEYSLPTKLIRVSNSNISSRTQLEL